MVRKHPITFLAYCWLPLAIFVAMAVLAVCANKLSTAIFWLLALIFIAILGFWKGAARRQIVSLLPSGQLNAEHRESVQHGFYVYRGMCVLIPVCLLTLYGLAWYCLHVYSWELALPLAAAWYVKKEIWMTIVGVAVSEHQEKAN